MQVTIRSSQLALFRPFRSHHLSSNTTAAGFLSTITPPPQPENDTLSSDDNKIKSFRDELDSGPDLGDFIAGVVPRNVDAFTEYSGKIKRESGETGRFVLLFLKSIFSLFMFCFSFRLRLPPWLKKEIPVGQNFHRLKSSLRKLNLHTVSLFAIYIVNYNCHFEGLRRSKMSKHWRMLGWWGRLNCHSNHHDNG